MLPFTKYLNVDAVLLKLLSYTQASKDKNRVIKELKLHPDYPSLWAVSEILSNFGIENQSLQIVNSNLPLIPTPFIAHTHKENYEFVLVCAVDERTVTINNGQLRQERLQREEFESIFNNIVLVTELHTEKPGLSVKIDDMLSNSYYSALLLGFIGLLFIAALMHSSWLASSSWQIGALVVTNIIGCIVATLLLIQTIDATNPFVKKICGINNQNCNAVLNSNAANIFRNLSWSEVGFCFFTGNLLAIITCGNSANVIGFLSIINICSLPYTLYSLFYQWRIVKQWCILCCAVQFLLWLQFTLFRVNAKNSYNELVWNHELISLVVSMLLPLLLWKIIKPIILQLDKVHPLEDQIRRFKTNVDYFNIALKAQPRYLLLDEKCCITLGNKEARTIVTMVSSPTCSPCSETHKHLEEILERRSDLQVQIVFAVDGLGQNVKAKVAQHLMAINSVSDQQRMRQALNNWYLTKNYESWANKYPVEMRSADIDKLKAQKTWCNQMNISVTPTILINGHPLPELYELKDLKYMLA